MVSLLLHTLLGAGLVALAARPAKKSQKITFQVVKEQPKQRVEFDEPPPPPPPPPPKPRPKLTKPIDLTKPQPKVEQPQSAAAAPQREGPPPPPVNFGVNAALISEAGSFAVQSGNTAMADPELAKKAKKDGQGGQGGPFVPVPVARVTKMPELLADHKVAYPEEARKAGIEGRVVLLLDIDESGRVVKAKVVKGAGHGMDEAALEAAYKFRFKPALAGADPVPVRINYTYTFLLED
jgi:protein TonB